MFKVSPVFMLVWVIHSMLLEGTAWWLLYYFGNTWTTWILSALLFAAGQVQYGWLQHDLLHGTVFNSTKINHFLHDVNLGFMQVLAIIG